MRYHMFTLAALLIGAVAGAHPAAVRAETAMSQLAPADEYFGRLKMSILGIRNRINELENESRDPALNNRSIAWKLSMVEDALADWQTKYPQDPWIGRFRTRLGSVYARISPAR